MNAHMPITGAQGDAQAERRRATLILIGLFWLFAFIVLSVRGALVDTYPLAVMTPRRLLTAGAGTLMCLGMAYALARLSTRSFPERVLWGIAGALVMSALLTLFSGVINRVIWPVPSFRPFDLTESVQWVMVWLGYFLAWTGTHLAMTYHWEARDQERHMAAMQVLTQEARIAALRYQVNPHFLFNALNSISASGPGKRNGEAEAMLLNLSAFLRSTLDADADGTIPSARRSRCSVPTQDRGSAVRGPDARGDRRPGRAWPSCVPALILQPLIENSVRHGVDRSGGDDDDPDRRSARRRAAEAARRG